MSNAFHAKIAKTGRKDRKVLTRIIFLLPLVILSSDLLAELISGPANVRIAPNQEVIVTLYDSIAVSCTPLRKGWYQISFSIKVTEEVYKNKKGIKKGDQLVGWDNRIIGIAVNDIPLSISMLWTSGGAPGNPMRFGMHIIGGYTHRDNIYNWSIPENPLNILLDEKRDNLELPVFDEFLEDFNFIKHGLLKNFAPNLTEYMIHENEIDDISPIDRIRLIFEDQTLIAIVHSRNLLARGGQTEKIARDRQLTIFSLPSNMDRKTFIEINIKAYRGVD